MSADPNDLSKKLNQTSTAFNVANHMMMMGLSGKLPMLRRFVQCSPIRHASNVTSIATSESDTATDVASIAMSAYAYIGHVPVLFGKSAFRFAPVIGHLMFAKDAYTLANGVIDARAAAGNEHCQVLKMHIGSMEECVTRGATKVIDMLANIQPTNHGSGSWD